MVRFRENTKKDRNYREEARGTAGLESNSSGVITETSDLRLIRWFPPFQGTSPDKSLPEDKGRGRPAG